MGERTDVSRGIVYGGKHHLLDAMRQFQILCHLWDGDEKCARIADGKRCWRKSLMLPVPWDNDINNDVGRSESVSNRDKNFE
jgi:hypothetical protein